MRVSYTQVATYERCPQSYKLRYLDKYTPLPQGPLVVGNALHSTLALYHQPSRRQPPSLQELTEAYCETYRKAGLPDDQAHQDLFAYGVQLLQGYHHQQQPEPRRTVAVELPFSIQLGEHLLSGRIDRIDASGPQSLELVDYKTGKMPDQHQVDADLQMALYHLAGAQLYPDQKVTTRLYYLAFGMRMTPRLTPERLEAARLRVLKAAQDVASRWFEPRLGVQCDWCDVRPSCEMFREPAPVQTPVPPGELLARYARVTTDLGSLRREQELLKTQIRLLLEQAGRPRYQAGGYVATLNKRAEKVYDMARLRQALHPLGLFDQVIKVDGTALAQVTRALDAAAAALVDTCWTRQPGPEVLQVRPAAGQDPEETDQ